MIRVIKIAGAIFGLFAMGVMSVLVYGFIQEQKKFQRISQDYMEPV